MVEKMNEKQGDRIRFFLSKADTAGHERTLKSASEDKFCLLCHISCAEAFNYDLHESNRYLKNFHRNLPGSSRQ